RNSWRWVRARRVGRRAAGLRKIPENRNRVLGSYPGLGEVHQGLSEWSSARRPISLIWERLLSSESSSPVRSRPTGYTLTEDGDSACDSGLGFRGWVLRRASAWAAARPGGTAESRG